MSAGGKKQVTWGGTMTQQILSNDSLLSQSDTPPGNRFFVNVGGRAMDSQFLEKQFSNNAPSSSAITSTKPPTSPHFTFQALQPEEDDYAPLSTSVAVKGPNVLSSTRFINNDNTSNNPFNDKNNSSSYPAFGGNVWERGENSPVDAAARLALHPSSSTPLFNNNNNNIEVSNNNNIIVNTSSGPNMGIDLAQYRKLKEEKQRQQQQQQQQQPFNNQFQPLPSPHPLQMMGGATHYELPLPIQPVMNNAPSPSLMMRAPSRSPSNANQPPLMLNMNAIPQNNLATMAANLGQSSSPSLHSPMLSFGSLSPGRDGNAWDDSSPRSDLFVRNPHERKGNGEGGWFRQTPQGQAMLKMARDSYL